MTAMPATPYPAIRRVFVDTSAYYALAIPQDAGHKTALALVEQLSRMPVRLFTTNLVVPETNGFIYRCGDIQALSAAIGKMAHLPEDRIRQMKEESLRLSRKLSFEACADGLEAAMKAVVHA